jgi:hypothetical protein
MIGDTGDRERDRKAQQDGADQRHEHEQIKIGAHAWAFSEWVTGSISRISSASDCSSTSTQKAGISDFSRNTASMPPTEIGPSRIFQELRTEGQDQ